MSEIEARRARCKGCVVKTLTIQRLANGSREKVWICTLAPGSPKKIEDVEKCPLGKG